MEYWIIQIKPFSSKKRNENIVLNFQKDCIRNNLFGMGWKRPHYAPLYSVMQGSPPPMRGKVSKENVPVLINGITPAYAGKSMSDPENTASL